MIRIRLTVASETHTTLAISRPDRPCEGFLEDLMDVDRGSRPADHLAPPLDVCVASLHASKPSDPQVACQPPRGSCDADVRRPSAHRLSNSRRMASSSGSAFVLHRTSLTFAEVSALSFVAAITLRSSEL